MLICNTMSPHTLAFQSTFKTHLVACRKLDTVSSIDPPHMLSRLQPITTSPTLSPGTPLWAHPRASSACREQATYPSAHSSVTAKPGKTSILAMTRLASAKRLVVSLSSSATTDADTRQRGYSFGALSQGATGVKGAQHTRSRGWIRCILICRVCMGMSLGVDDTARGVKRSYRKDIDELQERRVMKVVT
jgi:hypothetical protein